MTVDNKFTVKKIQKSDGFYAIFTPLTRMPLVVCHEETFDDQVFLFAFEEAAQKFTAQFTESHFPASSLKIPQPQMSGFLSSLYALDVNMVVYTDDAGESRIPLEDLSPRPDMEKMAKEMVPIMNPGLTLTSVYFLQELRRPGDKDNQKLKELEEEMLVHLTQSRYILAVETTGDSQGSAPNTMNVNNVRVPFVKTEAGDIYQPIYSDIAEFRKHNQNNLDKVKMSRLDFNQLPQFLQKNAKGYVINPYGFNLVITREQLERILA